MGVLPPKPDCTAAGFGDAEDELAVPMPNHGNPLSDYRQDKGKQLLLIKECYSNAQQVQLWVIETQD